MMFTVLLLAAACGGESEPKDTGKTGDVKDVVQDTAAEVLPEAVEEDLAVEAGDLALPDEATLPDTAPEAVEDVIPEIEPELPPELPPQELPPIVDHIVINEFVVTPTDQEFVEIYNGTGASVALSGWTLHVTTGSGENSWKLPDASLENGTFLLLKAGDQGNLTPIQAGDSLLPNQGGIIAIADGSGEGADSVAYGTKGPAPGPIHSTSTGRITDGGDSDNDATDFNWDPTPTPGQTNDIPGVALASSALVLNELFMNKDDDAADFIELSNAVWGDADVSGWTLIISGAGKGDDYVFPQGTVVAGSGLFVLDEAQFPEFADLADKGFIYLFDTNGIRVLQKGWSTLPQDGSASVGYLQPPAADAYPFCFDSGTCSLVSLTPTKGEKNKAL